MQPETVFFKTLKKSNVVFLKNPTKRKLLHLSGEKKGTVKQIQPIMYNKDFSTIVLEEMKKIDPTVTPTSLFSKGGTFRVQKDDIYLLEFLRDSEQNEANGGNLFKEVDVRKEELFQIEGFEAYDKAINLVMNSTDNEVRALGMNLISPSAVNWTIQKIKLDLRRKLGSSDDLVKKVNDFMGDAISEQKLLIALALKEGIIEIHEGRKVLWKGGDIFFTGSQSSDLTTELSLWLKNDEEGRSYLKAISDKLPTKKK